MSYTVVRHSAPYTKESIASCPEINPEGEVYNWWLVDQRRREDVIYADSHHDMALALSRQPRDGTPDENMSGRINAGLDAMFSLKKQLKDIIRSEPIMVPQWEAEIIMASLRYPEDLVYGWGDGNNDFIVEEVPTKNFETRDVWNSQVPLILFELHYEPYTHLQAPLSGYGEAMHPTNIKWVRVSSDYAFIDSFHVAGLIEYGRTLE